MNCPLLFPTAPGAVHGRAAPETRPRFCHCSHAAFLVLGRFVGLGHHTGRPRDIPRTARACRTTGPCCGHRLMVPPPHQAGFALGEGPSPGVLHLGVRSGLCGHASGKSRLCRPAFLSKQASTCQAGIMEAGTRPAELEHPGSSVPRGHG